MKNIPICDYDKPYQAAAKALKKLATESDNELIEKVSFEEDPKKKELRESKIIMIRKIVDECIDEYREGEYTLSEAIKELQDALSYIK